VNLNNWHSPHEDVALPRYRALCVDGSETLRGMFVNFLACLGFEADTASTVDQAMELSAERGPYVLIATCMYGIQGPGLELGKVLRAKDSQIAMILYSGFVPESLPDDGLRVGFDKFMEIPFPLNDLKIAICESLTQRGRKQIADYAAHCFSVYELIHPTTVSE
jgi:DNA-binding response OmpR family regulator